MPAVPSRYDAVVVGAGHNGLAAAAYLARAGRRVLVLERQGHVGGASVSAQVFPGVPAWLSRYAYLVSLLPAQIRDELGLDLTLRRRRFASFTPDPADPARGLLVDTADPAATRASFEAVVAGPDAAAWDGFYARTAVLARRLFPTMTAPLLGPAAARELVGAADWRDFVERPLLELVGETFRSDLVRGVVLTDGLIGTFSRGDEPRANRCFLYHVIGGGTGDWDVPVGGMGRVAAELERAARSAGAEIRTGATVTHVDPGSAGRPAEIAFHDDDGDHGVTADHVLAACAPAVADRLLGAAGAEPLDPDAQAPEGSQVKVNMLLARLPRLRSDVDPAAAFAGTFHINETASQLDAAWSTAAGGVLPDPLPAEIYCHTLTDSSILAPGLAATGAHTLTLFGLHTPARLFAADPEAGRAAALDAALRSLDSVLAEPVRDCLALDARGEPCVEVRTPVDLEEELALPGGHIFHRDLAWPWAESEALAGTWGVETVHPRLVLAGAGARRGGGVSGVAGRAAAMAVL